MIPRIISKNNLEEWLNDMAKNNLFYAPKYVNGDYDFKRVNSSSEIAFDYDRTRMSLKGFFLKPEEVLMTASVTKGNAKEVLPDEKTKIIFGARPCDITALNLLDRVFTKDYIDPYYVNRRESTVIIGYRCKEKCRTCFCGTMGSYKPLGGYDIMITELSPDSFLIEGGTIVGERIIRKYNHLSRETVDDDRSLIIEVFTKIEETFTPHAHTAGLKPLVDLSYTQKIWEKYDDICLSCGQCVTVCPTCWCFDIRETVSADPDDFGNIDKTARIRRWTSCLYRDYHTVAGGHVFKPTVASRLENYYKHKMRGIPEKYGVLGCVGCGRCISTCPVGIDIRETLKELTGEEIA